ncbi:hypothetical protein WAC87_002485 [Shigella flexneri]
MKNGRQAAEFYVAQYGMPYDDALSMVISEAFLRRAAIAYGPFMLKGSYALRQYLTPEQRQIRLPADLDWVGMAPQDRPALDRWVRAITTLTYIDDGVVFRDFKDNCFWRTNADYAMEDDFPTFNTDLLAFVGDEALEISVDVSFNLMLVPPPVPLTYLAAQGDHFVLPYTCPLELQISWKLHQSLIRPRFKDLLDLIWLLQRHDFDAQVCWQALIAECQTDRADIRYLRYLLDCSLAKHPRIASGLMNYQELCCQWEGSGKWSQWGGEKQVVLLPDVIDATPDSLLRGIDKALRQSALMPLISAVI